MNKRSAFLLTAGAFLAFFVFGFSDNLKGPVLPALLQDLQINYATGGTILLGIYIGFMGATISSGFIADRYGKKLVLILAGVALSAGIIAFSSMSTPWLLTASMVFLGFGLGCLELGCNALIVELHPDDKGRYLNLMSVMHGMGSMLAPVFAGWMLAANTSWRTVYRWDLLLTGLVIVTFSSLVFPAHTKPAETAKNTKSAKIALRPEVIGYFVAITAYVATELGVASWIVEYMQKVHSQSVSQSTQQLTLFFGLMMVGRFVGSFLIERLGYLRSILFAASGACVCLVAGVFAPAPFALLIPASGFFMSIIFPTITAAVSEAQTENTNSILGLLFTFAGLGGIIGPWLVGVASDLGGIHLGFGVNIVFGLLTAACVAVILQMKKSAQPVVTSALP